MNVKFWKCAAVRAVRTAAQTALGLVSASALLSEVRWIEVLSASVLAGLASVLMSLTGLPEAKEEAGK